MPSKCIIGQHRPWRPRAEGHRTRVPQCRLSTPGIMRSKNRGKPPRTQPNYSILGIIRPPESVLCRPRHNTLSGGRPSSASTVTMIFSVSGSRSRACAGTSRCPRLCAPRCLSGCADARDERAGRAVGEAPQRGCRLAREPVTGKLRVPDADLLEAFRALDAAVDADCAEEEARDDQPASFSRPLKSVSAKAQPSYL